MEVMGDRWYYARDGKEHGPFFPAALAAMATRGDLLPADLLRPEGTQDWRPANEFLELFPAGQSPAVSPGQPTTPRDPPTSDPSSLKGLTMALGIEPIEPGQDPLLGRDIGGVTIVRLIAEGGMGRVYEGLQENPQRSVAVKVMRPGFVSSEVARRFSLETEILARLQHPFIAQIFSAGMCDVVGTKVPYFVMEFIPDALSITRYASQKALGTRDRLALFRKACEAVAHGHHNGVIHRDLKPSNILVDRSGTPKVIDFGVARCVDAKPEQMTALTDMGQLIGTLQYMSPEQISADPSKVDVRSDVYALGVILYELLTGQRPYEISQQQIFEAMRVVHETKPVAPSTLNQEVQHDVELITGRCLHKRQEKRFDDAAQIVAALDRHLGGGRLRGTDAAREMTVDDVFTTSRNHSRSRRLILVIAALGALMATVAASLWHRTAPPPSPGERAWDFRQPDELDDFEHGGVAVGVPDGGVRLGNGVAYSAILTKEQFTYPLRVEYDVAAGPDRVYDIFPGLFVTPINTRTGIQYLFGDNANARSFVLVLGRYMGIPHDPIEPNRVYRIVLEVDSDRRLTVTRDGERIYEEILPEDAHLCGPVQCGGGLGDVTYKRLRIHQQLQPSTGATETPGFPIDAAVDVLDQGVWWTGRVLAPESDGHIRVAYTAWGSRREAMVSRTRIRAASPQRPHGTIAFNGHDYWFPKRKTNQIEAQLEAAKIGGSLVVIDDEAENAFVARHVHGTTWLGIGKSKDGWARLSGGDRVGYFSWDLEERQPSNFAGEVGATTSPSGEWHDNFATDELYFAVEWLDAITAEERRRTNNEETSSTEERAEVADPDPIVGRWRWFIEGGEVPGHECLPNGAIKGRPDSSWLLVDPNERRYQLLWGNRAFMDVMTMSPDGKMLRGRNNEGRLIEGRRD